MSASARILVATDNADDGRLVRKLLLDEFENVHVSSDPEKAVDDFEQRRPEVLLLAFDRLENAERYYLGLYRLAPAIHAIPHRTVMLCNKDQVREVYALCRRQTYDDYVLFWPMNHDASRLPMAVHHMLRWTANESEGRSVARDMAAQARALGDLDAIVERHAEAGGRQVEASGRSLELAGHEIGQALERFSQALLAGGPTSAVQVRDEAALRGQFNRFMTEEIEHQLARLAASIKPILDWSGALGTSLAPELAQVRALKESADRVRPIVLPVEDDDFQRKLVTVLLAGVDLELMTAGSATEALATMSRRQPDIVLMDIDLPDMSGIEATRRIKSVPRYAATTVFMVTGHNDKDAVVESIEAGSSGFLIKPFNKETLLAKLRPLLRGGDGRRAGAML